MEESAVVWEESDRLGVEHSVRLLVHLTIGKEECEERVYDAEVEGICSTIRRSSRTASCE